MDMISHPTFLQPVVADAAVNRFALISHRRHLAALGDPDPARLVLCTDWLTWSLARHAGHTALHFESQLVEWPAAAGDPDLFHMTATGWMMADGVDMTAFEGVSIGHQLDADVFFLARAYLRLSHALDRLCTTYRPAIIDLYDWRGEYDILDPAARRQLVDDVAQRHGIAVNAEKFDPPAPDDPGLQEIQHFGVRAVAPPSRDWLRKIYGRVIAAMFRARDLMAGRRPGIFIIHNWIVINRLIDALGKAGAAPVLTAEQWPKNAGFLWRCWTRGAVLTHRHSVTLSDEGRAALDIMRQRVEAVWAASPARDAYERSLRALIRTRLFESGLYIARAQEAQRLRKLLTARNIRRVVVADVANADNRLVMEVARSLAIPVDEMLNGMFMTGQRVEARTGNGSLPPLVDRFLSWGPQNEAWHRKIGARYPFVRTGYPAIGTPEPAASWDPATARRALVLPLTVDFSDTTGLRGNILQYLMMTLDVLRERGFERIVVKLHPGTPNMEYYDAAVKSGGFDACVVKDGPLAAHVKEADIVVGPVNSGSLVETAALGKPYIPLRAVPGSIDPDLCGSIPVAHDRDSLTALLTNGPASPAAVLDAFCDAGAIHDSGSRFWNVINDSLSA